LRSLRAISSQTVARKGAKNAKKRMRPSKPLFLVNHVLERLPGHKAPHVFQQHRQMPLGDAGLARTGKRNRSAPRWELDKRRRSP
jgi:hypothetical protein